jgi:hypothetical protein
LLIMKNLVALVLLGAAALQPLKAANPSAGPGQDKPNFIIIFTDDQGYNDLGCFGSKKIKTPHLDRMAEEGRKFTSFYVPARSARRRAPRCSPAATRSVWGCTSTCCSRPAGMASIPMS